jgi:hypothetical protein
MNFSRRDASGRRNVGHSPGIAARRISRTATIGPSSSAENFVVSAAAQSSAIAETFPIVSRRPARQTAQINAAVMSVSGTSFFTSGPCARKLGSRQ